MAAFGALTRSLDLVRLYGRALDVAKDAQGTFDVPLAHVRL